MSAARVIAAVLLIGCSESSKEAPPTSAPPPSAPTGPVEIELPEMGVALTVPAGWKPDRTRDTTRRNQPRQAQHVMSPGVKMFVTVNRISEPIHSLEDAKRVVPQRMHSLDVVGLRDAQELPTGTLLVVHNVRMKTGSSTVFPKLRVIIKGEHPLTCDASGGGDHDFELLRSICVTLRPL